MKGVIFNVMHKWQKEEDSGSSTESSPFLHSLFDSSGADKLIDSVLIEANSKSSSLRTKNQWRYPELAFEIYHLAGNAALSVFFLLDRCLCIWFSSKDSIHKLLTKLINDEEKLPFLPLGELPQ